jgi:o-succinylbenzoate synthase
MSMKASVHPIVFDFAFEAGTSRGVLTQKTSWFICLEEAGVCGWGECSPIAGLSPEPFEILEAKISTVLEEWVRHPEAILDPSSAWVEELMLWPSLRFALETAYLDFNNGGRHLIFDTDFFQGKQAIPINGLVWMNTMTHMEQQVENKIQQGFQCIKLKIGHHPVEQELALLKQLRNRFPKEFMTIRVDANGAYTLENIVPVLEALAALGVHSIEQPIRAGDHEGMARLCRESPVPIALDEELIVPLSRVEKMVLLAQLKPQYIVLKPSLHGGIMGCKAWIEAAEAQGIAWWMTSYLESAIGLNAIAQLVSTYPSLSYQGLGTGQLYTKTIASPLEVKQGRLLYNPLKSWEIPTAHLF